MLYLSSEDFTKVFFYASLVHLSLLMTVHHFSSHFSPSYDSSGSIQKTTPAKYKLAVLSFLSFLNAALLIVWGTLESTPASLQTQVFVLGLVMLLAWIVIQCTFLDPPPDKPKTR
ncbi:hypothetical protein FVEG_16497 [Fusarium verticillioides 7600]|uniref:Uncharacterized protein n=1 Tax=Gibberella moniliformis (strain M3125 / FGSC 7600) TaxID=334819 RepID=W7MPJ0_GIBM7|nr:hypothetical protein FVEG_16497 [Fusarium verticillioides 7600]EWG49505.1 hypothetical protein FVEG_16497 [Fusarium verticillioides 7600]RBR03866.1 hypothetical protein FVER53590_25871 [Fusarium verticillioides]